MKRGYLWVDWVELGCRGWEIDESGAEAAPVGCCEDDCAHLDRTTLQLMVSGCRRFVEARKAREVLLARFRERAA